MFNVGGGEIIVIALIALIVLGPQRLPGAARQVGKAMGELRRMSSSFQSELKSALDDDGPSGSPARQVKPLGDPSPSAADEPTAKALRAVSEQAQPTDRANGAAHRPRRTPLRAEPLAADGAGGDEPRDRDAR